MKTNNNTTSTNLALVSPCSTCKNQQATSSPGLPVCPRRQWQALVSSLQQTNGDISNISHLALYGTEGTTSSGDGSLRNPVYSSDMHTIMVWTALLKDNVGIVGNDGVLVTSSILESNFNNKYIVCNRLPFVPRDQEATYFQKGAFSEGDQIEVSDTSGAQLVMGTGDLGTSVLTAGFAQKVSFMFNHPRSPVNMDVCPSGI